MPVFLKKHKFLLLLLILVYASYFLFHYKSSHTITQQEVRGVRTNVSLFKEPEDGRDPIINALNSAKQSIHVEVYLLSDSEVIDTLIAKKQEGLNVKVMLEQHPFGGGNVNIKTKKTLEDADVPVIWTNPTFALTHEKTIIIDGTEVFILNQNLTASSFGKNREFDIIDDSPDYAQEVERIFDADWNRLSFTPAQSNLVISPINSRDKLTSLLLNATGETDVEMEIITDKDIVNLLASKAKAEKIMVIIPDFNKVSANQPFARQLEDSGIDVRTISSPYIHAKLVVTDDTKAYVGSINFTSQSMDENRELGIIVSEAGVVQNLTESFDSDWSKTVDYK